MVRLKECRGCGFFKNAVFGDPVKGEYVVCRYEYDDRLAALLNVDGGVMVHCPDPSRGNKPADRTATIDALRREALRFRDERNWKQFHTPSSLAAGLSIEAAELMEIFLWKTPGEIDALLESEKGRKRLREEIADIGVYLLYLSDACGIDLASAILDKLAQNAVKYPVDKSYNSSRKYDELDAD
jgi:NTP pyrophosphatase (non-canonical NTP hydrolase)